MTTTSNLFKNLNAFREKELQDEILKVGKIISAGKGAVLTMGKLSQFCQ